MHIESQCGITVNVHTNLCRKNEAKENDVIRSPTTKTEDNILVSEDIIFERSAHGAQIRKKRQLLVESFGLFTVASFFTASFFFTASTEKTRGV